MANIAAFNLSAALTELRVAIGLCDRRGRNENFSLPPVATVTPGKKHGQPSLRLTALADPMRHQQFDHGRFAAANVLGRAVLILNRIGKGSCELYGKRLRI